MSVPISDTASFDELSKKKRRMQEFLRSIGVEPIVEEVDEQEPFQQPLYDTPQTPPPPPVDRSVRRSGGSRSRGGRGGYNTGYSSSTGVIVINNIGDVGEPHHHGGHYQPDDTRVDIGGNASNDSAPINIGGSESRDDSTSAVDIGGSETPATSTPEVDLGGSPTSDEPSWDSGNSDPIPDTGSFDTGSVEIGGYSSDG